MSETRILTFLIFEEKLMNFKSDFSRNYEIAHSHFDKAVDEIDKTIQHLEKVKKETVRF